MRRVVRVAVFCAASAGGLAGCISFTNVPLELRATDAQSHVSVYEDASANDGMPKFSEIVLRGTIGAEVRQYDVFETGSTATRKKPVRGINEHYNAVAVVDELVNRHTNEAKFYLRALCDRCL